MIFSLPTHAAYELPATRSPGVFDRAANRPRFAPPVTIVGVGAVCALMLALLLPRPETLVRSVMHGDLRDHVVEQYLASLLRAQPQDDTLRFRLAEQRMALQQFNGALHLLQPLIDGSNIDWQRKATRLAVEGLEQQFYAAAADSAERRSVGQRLRTLVQWLLVHDDNPVLLERLATKALAIGEPVIAARIFQRIATMGERWPEWYADAARIALAAGDTDTSARFYAIAQSRTTDPESRQTFLMAAMKALVAGNRLDDAVAYAAQSEGDLGATDELRDYLVALHAQSRPSPARELLRSRLRATISATLAAESSAGVLERLLTQAKALGDSGLTLQVLERAANTQPDRESAWYDNAARLALGQGEYALSARFHFAAARQAVEKQDKRRQFTAGLRALQAGNIVAQHLEHAEAELGELEGDRDTLYVMAQLALGAHRLDLAERYARRMLRPDA